MHSPGVSASSAPVSRRARCKNKVRTATTVQKQTSQYLCKSASSDNQTASDARDLFRTPKSAKNGKSDALPRVVMDDTCPAQSVKSERGLDVPEVVMDDACMRVDGSSSKSTEFSLEPGEGCFPRVLARSRKFRDSFPVELTSKEFKICSASRATARLELPTGPSGSSGPSIPRALLLYWTLVDQGILPPDFEEDFMKFGEAWQEAAESDDERKRSWTNVSAALGLAERKRGLESSKKEEKQAKDQFLLAATQRPLRFRSRLQKLQYEGATARKDAEEDERSRWLHVLAGIVSNTDTPMGRLLRDKLEGVKLLGAGQRASTLRSRIRAVRKYVVWLSSAFAVAFPRDVMHAIEYLQMRLSEPSGRGAIKGAHQAMVFFEEVSGIPEAERCTSSPLYLLAKKEVLAAALPGAEPRQAPRFPTVVLGALEELVTSEETLVYLRLYAWWILVQCWGTLRFSDHRGIAPPDVTLDSQGFTAKLRHAKTICSDRSLNMRLVVVDCACFVQDKRWMEKGWRLMRQDERDYLLPSPSGNYRGCVRRELKYPVGAAVQAQILANLRFRQQQVFDRRVAHFSQRSELHAVGISSCGVPKVGP